MISAFLRALDARARARRPALFWWRDDDCVDPSGPLDRLLHLSETHAVPVTLAVIPATTGPALAERLKGLDRVSVAVHGWSHQNHAPAREKKQELGAHRPVDVILDELSRGYTALRALHGASFVPVLVPPWNRIAPAVVEGLAGIGFEAVSTFGLARPAPLSVVNTHVDLMDWHGTRGGHPTEMLLQTILGAIAQPQPGAIGILSHHLVHDAQAWSFLEEIFDLTRGHPGCRWVSVTDPQSAAPRI